MTPDSLYPAPLPLGREHAVALAEDLDGRAAIPGAFLTFVMFPVEERIGEWRFAGASRSLAQALRRVDEFSRALAAGEQEDEPEPWDWLETDALEAWTDLSDAWSYDDLPLAEIGEHRVVLLFEGQAPYDDSGVCVLEVETLGAWAERPPQTERPATWSERDGDDGDEDDEE